MIPPAVINQLKIAKITAYYIIKRFYQFGTTKGIRKSGRTR